MVCFSASHRKPPKYWRKRPKEMGNLDPNFCWCKSRKLGTSQKVLGLKQSQKNVMTASDICKWNWLPHLSFYAPYWKSALHFLLLSSRRDQVLPALERQASYLARTIRQLCAFPYHKSRASSGLHQRVFPLLSCLFIYLLLPLYECSVMQS